MRGCARSAFKGRARDLVAQRGTPSPSSVAVFVVAPSCRRQRSRAPSCRSGRRPRGVSPHPRGGRLSAAASGFSPSTISMSSHRTSTPWRAARPASSSCPPRGSRRHRCVAVDGKRAGVDALPPHPAVDHRCGGRQVGVHELVGARPRAVPGRGRAARGGRSRSRRRCVGEAPRSPRPQTRRAVARGRFRCNRVLRRVAANPRGAPQRRRDRSRTVPSLA